MRGKETHFRLCSTQRKEDILYCEHKHVKKSRVKKKKKKAKRSERKGRELIEKKEIKIKIQIQYRYNIDITLIMHHESCVELVGRVSHRPYVVIVSFLSQRSPAIASHFKDR